MALSFERLEDADSIRRLSEIARGIWFGYWEPRIGRAQAEYMYEMMLTPEAIGRDMDEHGYRYWIIGDGEGRVLGFTGGCTEELGGDDTHMRRSPVVDGRWPRRWFISKVYLLEAERGKGYARPIMEFYAELCRAEGLPAMYLTVNRENEGAVRAYEAMGFETVEIVDTDIGHGFEMNDFIMAREIEAG